jgi:hypothetical protein
MHRFIGTGKKLWYSSIEGRLGINVLIRQCRKSVWSKIVMIIRSRKLFYLYVLANGCKTWPRI